jgi:hypothetical protein
MQSILCLQKKRKEELAELREPVVQVQFQDPLLAA